MTKCVVRLLRAPLTLLVLAGCAVQPPATRPVASVQAAPAAGSMSIDLGRQEPSAPLARQVIPGTGTLVGLPGDAQPAAPAAGEGFELNFADTDVQTIVASVLGDGLNLPYVIDPQVKGNMTLQATRALSRDEVLAALESALRVQGFALVIQGGVYHVVPGKDAPRRITNLQNPAQGGRGYGIYIVPLQFISATEMDKILQPFAPEGGVIRVDEARNLLLLAGTSQEISTLLNVVRTFDVDWLAGMSFALYPLDYVDAKTIATELGEVFSSAKSPIAGVVRLVPLTRLNALMVITPQAKYLQDVEAWIKRLDVGATTPGRRIYVYEVQNGKADDLAQVLGRILSIETLSATDSSGSSGSASDFSFSNSLGASGTSSFGASRAAVQRAAAPVSQPPAGNGGGGASSDSDGTALDAGALRIVPSDENNSLLILASPSEFAVIEAALRRLDVLPIQVLIEASIAEVTLTDDIRYGLQFSYQSGDGPIVLSESGNGSISPQFPGFSYLYTGKADIRAVLNAIESLTNVRVISAPKLIVLNNREAQLQVGDQVPITVQSSVGISDPLSPIVNSVQLRDTGVILRVTPRANKSGRVILDVAQEVSDVARTTSSGIDSPTIQQRKLSSTVVVQDGDTIALGGLIRDSRSNGGSGIPYLRKIPILGQAFGSTNKEARRTELIVLITPHVIRSAEESEEVMEELRKQFRGLRQAFPPAAPQLPAVSPQPAVNPATPPELPPGPTPQSTTPLPPQQPQFQSPPPPQQQPATPTPGQLLSPQGPATQAPTPTLPPAGTPIPPQPAPNLPPQLVPAPPQPAPSPP
jgi:general secretion pathway protein D